MSLTKILRLAAGAAAAWMILASAAMAQTGPQPPKALRIGVGGDYPAGLDGLLTSRGLPYERVLPWEMADPEVLKRYEVLLLSCPVATKGSLDAALLEWIRAGGRAYVETWPAMQGAYPLPGLFALAGNTPEHTDVVLATTDHPITRGLDPKLPIDLFHLTGTYLRPAQPEGAKVLADFCDDGGGSPRPEGAALVVLPVGKGELVYSGAPLSFVCFHRGPTPEPLMRRIIDTLAQGRALSRLTAGTVAPAPPAAQPPAPQRTASDEGAGKPPSGLEAVDNLPEGPYNLSARIGRARSGGDKPALLLLDGRFGADGKPGGPCLWLSLGRTRVELRAGKAANAPVVASARWQAPAAAADLLVRRRPGGLSVVVGDREVLSARVVAVGAGGMVAAGKGCLTLADLRCQPVGDPAFGDDFMREPGESSAWTTVSGQWYAVGVGHESQSVNGFYYRGYGAKPALAVAGDAWWDDYTVGASVRLDSGDGTCGLCALRQASGDSLALLADSSRKPGASLRLVRMHGAKESTLAKRPGGIDPGQWVRLAIRLRGGKVEALVDGEPVLQCPNREPRGGGIGLLVRGSARFDDVLVQPSAEPLASPRDEGSPAAELPASVGPQDRLSWANPAGVWTACPDRPPLLWHTGAFPGDVTVSLGIAPVDQPSVRRLILAPSPGSPEQGWLSVSARILPGTGQVGVVVSAPGTPPVERRMSLGSGGALALARRNGTVAVRWQGQPLVEGLRGAGLSRVGVEFEGAPVPVESLQVRSPGVRDYVFGVAPTDWYASSGTWEVASRWACDNRWSWFAGWGSGDFAVWNKHPVEGDVAVSYWVGVKMEAPGGPETTRCRDLNAVLCGNRSDPRSGYSFILGGDGGVKTQLLRKGVVVAEGPDIRVPAGYGIHHEWFRVRLSRVGHRIEMDFDGRPVFRYDDPDPLPGGYVGLWSRDSGILVPRVTIYSR